MGSENYRRRWSDERRIDILDSHDRAYWCKFFGVDVIDLMHAVDKVGTSVERVRQYLHRHAVHDWIVDGGRQERRGGAPARRNWGPT